MKKDELFEQIKLGLGVIDPIFFIEKYLTLDGRPFRINGNGYKPFADIYRTIGIKSLEKNALPIVLVKGRQVGATTMAAALEMYFMACGLFGKNNKPPIRIMHCFPQLDLAAAYTKTKLSPIISSAIFVENKNLPKNKKAKNFIESKLTSTDSLYFKEFENGNHIWVESIGIDANRVRGRTVDGMFFDECFPFEQLVITSEGKVKIGELVEKYQKNITLPLIKTYNELTQKCEFKKIVKAWSQGFRSLLKITTSDFSFKCTENHPFMTVEGWVKAKELTTEYHIKSFEEKEFENTCNSKIKKIEYLAEKLEVYDLQIEDNHNFFIASADSEIGLLAHNCQDMRGAAIGNATKILSKAQYGKVGDGIQVYFGTPKQKGSEYWKIWMASSQQYYYLGCEQCKKHFPLYTPGSNEWEQIWIEDHLPEDHPSHGFIVKCTHCGCEQDKREAAERGKWIAHNINEHSIKFIGYHINQLYMPDFPRWKIIGEKPENHPINTERTYQNEVLGEFYAGSANPLSPEEIDTHCADHERKFAIHIPHVEGRKVYLGCDWGQKVDAEQMAEGKGSQQGQSYSCVVVLATNGPHILTVEYAWRLDRNNLQRKKEIVEEIFRRYNIDLGVGDVGYANDLTEILQQTYGDKFLGSRSASSIRNHVKFEDQVFPKEIRFDKDYCISELYSVLKEGKIRFPYGDYEKIAWLISHCCSMELKPVKSKDGSLGSRYVKGNTPNDGFMALLNAYLAYKFDITGGFNIRNPHLMKKEPGRKDAPLAVLGYVPGL